jgi:hypothetical protein
VSRYKFPRGRGASKSRDGSPSSRPGHTYPPCSCNEDEICKDGYPSWVLWNRAQMLAWQHRDYSGYEQAKRSWELHLKESK